jgi:hypothetical protein
MNEIKGGRNLKETTKILYTTKTGKEWSLKSS